MSAVAAEPKRILIVDDDVALLRVVREALVASLRCEVDTSPKPEYAFELSLKKKYDLLIFDFQMPMIDGAMLFFLIGKVYQNSHPVREVPPLLLISGKAEEARAQEVIKEPGVAGLVAKPFAINRLLEKSRKPFPRSSRQLSEARISAGRSRRGAVVLLPANPNLRRREGRIGAVARI